MNIVSFNVNGIGQRNKRTSIFQKLLSLNTIAFLQETHSESSYERSWKQEWPGQIFFSHGTSNSRGVCIMIPNNIPCDIQDKIIDDEGRYIILKVKIETQIFILCNVYAPTREYKLQQINFTKNLKSALLPFENENLLVGGDFNLYLNPKLDKLDTMSNKGDNPVYRNEILSLLDSMAISDAWRNLYPLSRRYTWHSHGKSSRLDYWFISEHLLNNLTEYKIMPGLHSDHSILKINLGHNNLNRGRGYWKFNNNLLHDLEYVSQIKKFIKESKLEYENLSDKGLVWELVKLKIRSFSVPYCIKKKRIELRSKMN